MVIDGKLLEGARNAVQVCMNVGGTDRVFILTDDETAIIADTLAQEAANLGAEVAVTRIEEFGTRPMTALPDGLAQKLTTFAPTVTFYTASSKAYELPLRSGFVGLAMSQFGVRHAHMPGITRLLMQEGMLADYHEVHDLTMRVYEIVRRAKMIHVTSRDGTDLTARFDEKLKWEPCHGLYHDPRSGGNLPEGEVFTSPAHVEGVFFTRVLGDYFSGKYGILPELMGFEITDSFCTRVISNQKDITAEMEDYLDSAENGRRVGEFAIGTNTAVTVLRGSMLQDEKIPGVHIAFGSPLNDSTGAEWTSAIHIDVVNPECTIEVDGVVLMREGRFILPPEE